MNARYYKAIYLDWNPSPLDYSLLDTDEFPDESKLHVSRIEVFTHDTFSAKMGSEFGAGAFSIKKEKWLKASLSIHSVSGKNTAMLTLKCFANGKVVKEKRFRFATPKSKEHVQMTYACYLKLPEEKTDYVAVGIDSFDQYKGKNAKLEVTGFN